jgi:RNA polymerase sigma-70 factor (ECF subfamily)
MSTLVASIDVRCAGQVTSLAGAVPPRTGGLHTESNCVTEPSLDEDVATVQRIGRRDHDAYRVMVDRYLTGITRFAARILGDASEAEEVAQETFLRLWTEAARFEPRAKPKTWLYRIARNQCIDRLRKRRPQASDEELGASEDRPSGLFARKETAERVERALAALPERQRAALMLVHYEGLSGAEACEVLAISQDALESLLSRGRRSLREQLRELEDFRSGEGS